MKNITKSHSFLPNNYLYQIIFKEGIAVIDIK
jgi:hypothetical protein